MGTAENGLSRVARHFSQLIDGKLPCSSRRSGDDIFWLRNQITKTQNLLSNKIKKRTAFEPKQPNFNWPPNFPAIRYCITWWYRLSKLTLVFYWRAEPVAITALKLCVIRNKHLASARSGTFSQSAHIFLDIITKALTDNQNLTGCVVCTNDVLL